MEKKKIVIAVTGASGAVYSRSILNELKALSEQLVRVDLIFTEEGKQVWQHELKGESYEHYPFHYYDNKDFFAPCASGSAQYDAMIICPCSMGTLGRIANGISADLIGRCADVILKERKTLVLVPREAPYNSIHLQNMLQLSQMGVVILPASPSFYHHPKSMDELIATVTKKALKMAGIDLPFRQWGE